jgi:hypothetical protein
MGYHLLECRICMEGFNALFIFCLSGTLVYGLREVYFNTRLFGRSDPGGKNSLTSRHPILRMEVMVGPALDAMV